MKLGLVTYNLAATWDLKTLLSRCCEAGVDGVELRTTHAHGVEPTLSAQQRREVRQRCTDAGIAIWGLGTVCEFHSPDPAEVLRHVRSCQDFVRLAADLGAKGVKVRPNALPEGVPQEKTLAQIGSALAACGEFASDHGVEIWLEVHGQGTSLPANVRATMDACRHPAVGVCWNSNMTDRGQDGSIRTSFELLRSFIWSCHITDLDSSYPWNELFALLAQTSYNRFTLCEYPQSMDPAAGVSFLIEYRRRWLDLVRQAGQATTA